jgi:hypothetical protein
MSSVYRVFQIKGGHEMNRFVDWRGQMNPT